MSRHLERLWQAEHERRILGRLPHELRGDSAPEPRRLLPPERRGKPGPRGMTREAVDEMRRLREQGLLLTVIAQRFGVHERTVRKHLNGRMS